MEEEKQALEKMECYQSGNTDDLLLDSIDESGEEGNKIENEAIENQVHVENECIEGIGTFGNINKSNYNNKKSEYVNTNNSVIAAELSSIITDLARKKQISDEEITNKIELLREIYSKGYRHSYYNISSTIYQLANEFDVLEVLGVNMDKIYDKALYICNGDSKEIINGINKFYDHIMLEIVRINEYQSKINQIQIYVSEFDKMRDETQEQLENFTQELNLSQNKMNDLEKTTQEKFDKMLEDMEQELVEAKKGYLGNVVAILGVFSGILIGFFGSLQYASSVFANVDAVSKYRLVIMTLIIGFVLFNTVVVMLKYIGYVIGIDNSKSRSNSNGNKVVRIFWVNFSIIGMIIIVFVLWVLSNKLVLPL